MDCRRLSSLALVLLTLLLPDVSHLAHAFSQGAPDGACGSMVPVHQVAAQPTKPPYTIDVSAFELSAGDSVKVTISGDQPFMGFMASALSSGFPVGTVKALDPDSKVICNDLSVTHASPMAKKKVTFEWTAPDDLLEGTLIDFKATVVQQRVVFWENIVSTQPVIFIKPLDAPPGGIIRTSGREGGLLVPQPASPMLNASQHDHNDHAHGSSAAGLTSPAPAQPKSSGSLSLDKDCGKSKACFHDCKSGRCTFVVSWEDKQDNVAFHIVYRLPDGNKRWIALGFSNDDEMGDDSVTECIIFDDGKIKVQQSFNKGLFNNYIANKRAGISADSGTVVDGVLHCHFNRKKHYAQDERVFDLTKEYYLMVAVGEALKGNKLPHAFDVLPEVSKTKVSLLKVVDIARKEHTDSPLIRAHGALMIIAWVLFISIGVTSAKYGKPIWSKVNLFGSNIWFQLHRAFMVGTVTFTAVGILLTLIHCKGYCQIAKVPGKSHWPIHPPLGIFVFLLCVANPIMALFRPALTSASRYIFNWSHWGVGVLAWIMAVLTIFIGLDLEMARAPPEAMHVMLAYAVYHVLFLVAMETLPRPVRRYYDALAEMTLQRGRMYNLERATHENASYLAEDGDVDILSRQASYPSYHTSDTTSIQKPEEDKEGKRLTRDELQVQKIMLLGHFCFVTVFTLCLLLVVYLYTPLSDGGPHNG